MKFKHLTINCQLFSYSVILSFILFFSSPLKAQVTVGSQNAPDGNALLDLRQNTADSLSTKGLLLPRVALTSTTSSSPLTAHVKGMFVYNTATANDVKPGIYYNDGTKWMTSTATATNAGADSWLTAGNAGTDPTNNFLGTTDDQPLMFRVNNQPAGTINHALTQTALGYAALASNTAGTDNTAVGDNALFANTGSYNTAIGSQALSSNTTGTYNTAIGYRALSSNTTGTYNTAIGSQALLSNTTGSYNLGIGGALLTNSIGNYNLGIGFAALYQSNGSYNVAFGYYANGINLSGSGNTAIGNYALFYSGKDGNTALGDSAAYNLMGGSYNTIIGYKVAASSITTNNEVTIGTNGSTVSTYRMFGAAWTNASDRRLKHDIQPIGQGLDFVMNLKPVEFVYNGRDNLKSLGFIAQDVQETMNQNNMSNYELVTKMDGDTLGLSTTELIPVLTKAIQEQQTTIAQLQQQISDLTQRMEAVEQKNN